MSTGSITRKNKVFLVIFLLLFSYVFINLVNAIIVGRLIVPSSVYARLSILIDDEQCVEKSYCPGQTVKITDKLENLRNVNLIGNLTTIILNTTNQEIHRETWAVNLSVGEVLYKNTNYTVQEKDERGLYRVISNFTFGGNFSDSTCRFRVKKGIGTLFRYPDVITGTIPPGRSKIYPAGIQLWLDEACNSTNAYLNTTTGIPSEWVSFFPNTVHLTPSIINTTDVNITVPPITPEGVYDNGTIFAYADGQSVNVRLNITVSYVDFLLKVTLPNKKVCEGNSIDAIVNITKILPPEDVNVNLTYKIVDVNGTTYDERRDQNFTINENETIILSTLRPPSITGNYIFLVTLEHNLTLVSAYDTFDVDSCPVTTIPNIINPPIQPPEEEILPSKVYNITLNVSDTILTVILGNRTSFFATVNNTGTEVVKSVKISIEGIPNEWITVYPSTKDIQPRIAEKYIIIINVPNTTDVGVYKLNVKATDGVESNTVVLTLVIGRNYKEISDLLLEELEKIKIEAERALLIKKCLNISIVEISYNDAEYAMTKGKEEYEKGEYEKAIDWYEYAMVTFTKVIQNVDIILEIELRNSNASKFLIPPFFKPEEQFRMVREYITLKNYEKICEPVVRIRRYILAGLIFWPMMFILLIILLILLVLYLRKHRKQKREVVLTEAKERIEKVPSTEG